MRQFNTAIPEDPSKELFIKRCTELIERRGHRFVRVGEKRINAKGETEVFDITYGWPIRHYCRCSFSDNPIRSSDLKAFEKSLKQCRILPTRGVFFSKSPFVKDDLDFDVFCVDPDAYAVLYRDAFKDRCLHWILYMSIATAFCILVYSCSSDDNVKKRQIINAYHRYMNREKTQSQIQEEEEEDLTPPPEEDLTPPPEEESPPSQEPIPASETWGEWIVKEFWALLGYSCACLWNKPEYREKECFSWNTYL